MINVSNDIMNNKIFVCIASYRDSELQYTIRDLFIKSLNSHNIYVGVCCQYDYEHDDLFHADMIQPEHIRWHHMKHTEAKGPCYARSIAQKLWRDEEYYLQIDSHMRFVEHWDDKLIQLYNEINQKKAIITTYPPGYELPNTIDHQAKPSLLCASSFDKDGMLHLKARALVADAFQHQNFIHSLFWAAGFAFSSSQVIKDVPYDPNLEFVFFGEEQSMAARLWTNGYEFYCPKHHFVYHLWSRQHRHTFRELSCETKDDGLKRIKLLFQKKDDTNILKEYGLGHQRSLHDFEIFTGVQYDKQEIKEYAKNGGLVDSEQFYKAPFENLNDNLIKMISSFT